MSPFDWSNTSVLVTGAAEKGLVRSVDRLRRADQNKLTERGWVIVVCDAALPKPGRGAEVPE